MHLPHLINSSIKIKIILSLIIVVSVVFAAQQAYEYKQESDSSIKELNEFSHRTIVRMAENLVFPLWELDDEWVNKIIETEMLDKNIYALVVTGEGGLSEGKKRNRQWQPVNVDRDIEGDYLVQSKEILRNGEKIGAVDLYVTTKFVEARLRKSIRNNILVTVLLVITITLSLLMALNKIIVFPLKDILLTVKAIAEGDYSRDVVIKQNDEIGMLADNFNAMKNNVHQREEERDKALVKLKDRTGELIETQAELQQDVAERIKAQKEVDEVRHYLKNIIDSMPSMLVGVDIDGCVTHWNLEAERISGISEGDAIGHPMDEVVPMLSREVERVRVAIRQRQPENLDRMSHDVDGQRHYADVMIYPLVGNAAVGAVIRIDDITERIRIEQLMTQTEKMMSVGGLAAGMAHELNNPLGGMLQGLQNIRRRLSPELNKNREVADELDLDLEKMHEYVQRREIEHFMEGMAEAGHRASDIVENMLRFSRKAEVNVSPEDLGVLIDRTVELASVDYDLKKKFDFRAIELQHEYEPGLPRVPCVASEIQQVLLNLLRNAAQALFEQEDRTEPQRITLRTRQEGDLVCIEVEDNGPGIDEATRQRVFEPFYTTRPPGEGTGLGLSVSYFIMHDEHGGSIDVESTPGKGTKFIMCLPMGGDISEKAFDQ